MATNEQVVLLDNTGAPIGSASKSEVHTDHTPLHLAFSCYLLNDSGNVLLTRRALSKLTWPGVWTNSVCGHPAPGESFEEAIMRRGIGELGAQIDEIELVLPNFRYRATDASGIVENEICPVYIARLTGTINPRPAEVSELAWISPVDLTRVIARAPFAFSPWMVEQVPQLASHPTTRFRVQR